MCSYLLSLITIGTNSVSLKWALVETLIQKEFTLVPNLQSRDNPHIVMELVTALTLFLNQRHKNLQLLRLLCSQGYI